MSNRNEPQQTLAKLSEPQRTYANLSLASLALAGEPCRTVAERTRAWTNLSKPQLIVVHRSERQRTPANLGERQQT